MTLLRRWAAALACLASSVALAQAPAPAPAPAAGFAPFKGKMKEGLYEVKSEHDMSGVPGVPKEHHKGAETKQRCMSKAELERGINAGKGCKIANTRESGNNANVRMECQDGTATEVSLTLNPTGYASELKTTGKQDGKTFTSVFRSQAKYLGPCPAAAPAPAK